MLTVQVLDGSNTAVFSLTVGRLVVTTDDQVRADVIASLQNALTAMTKDVGTDTVPTAVMDALNSLNMKVDAMAGLGDDISALQAAVNGIQSSVTDLGTRFQAALDAAKAAGATPAQLADLEAANTSLQTLKSQIDAVGAPPAPVVNPTPEPTPTPTPTP